MSIGARTVSIDINHVAKWPTRSSDDRSGNYIGQRGQQYPLYYPSTIGDMDVTELDLSSIDTLSECDFLLDSSWHTDIYLDPETGKVYAFEAINGIPERAYHNIDQFICRVGNRAVANSVRDNVLLVDERLRDMIELFIGAEWNGQNFVGKWKEARDHDWKEPFHEYFQEHISIMSYADPDSWFADQDLKALWAAGRSPKEVVDSSELDNGDECCHEGDAVEYIEKTWAMWAEGSDENN